MVDFFAGLLETSDFTARWNCGNWTRALGWLHIVSDIAVWSAYTAIPVVIVFFMLRRRDMPFPKVFWLFGTFIFACGATHLVEAAMFWWPAYRLSGAMKFGTAVVSWATVLALIRVVPTALRLPGLDKVNRDLRRANHELDEFAAIVSHDLRAPLRAITSLATWISEDAKNLDPESKENLRLLVGRVRRMDQLIEGILRYSKVGRGVTNALPLETEKTVKEVISALDQPGNVQIQVVSPLPEIVFDGTMFQQIMQNLISNCLKHMGRVDGRVVISCKSLGAYWQFSVADNGIGIPKQHLDRIFKPFQSLKPGEDNETTGIGLAIVKKIADSTGGSVWAESTENMGSTFHFTVRKSPAIKDGGRLRPIESQS
jgi:chemotaxis family two-component system sensor kinase Cph1